MHVSQSVLHNGVTQGLQLSPTVFTVDIVLCYSIECICYGRHIVLRMGNGYTCAVDKCGTCIYRNPIIIIIIMCRPYGVNFPFFVVQMYFPGSEHPDDVFCHIVHDCFLSLAFD